MRVAQVAVDRERHPDLPVAVAQVRAETQEPLPVEIALKARPLRLDRDPARGGVVDQRGRQAAGQRVQHELDRVGPLLAAEQRRQLIVGDLDGLRVAHLRARPVEPVDPRAVQPAIDPPVLQPEPERPDLGLLRDRRDGREQRLAVHTVHPVRRRHPALIHGWRPRARQRACRSALDPAPVAELPAVSGAAVPRRLTRPARSGGAPRPACGRGPPPGRTRLSPPALPSAPSAAPARGPRSPRPRRAAPRRAPADLTLAGAANDPGRPPRSARRSPRRSAARPQAALTSSRTTCSRMRFGCSSSSNHSAPPRAPSGAAPRGSGPR